MKKYFLCMLILSSLIVFGNEQCHIEVVTSSKDGISVPSEQITQLRGTDSDFTSYSYERKLKRSKHSRTTIQKLTGRNKFYRSELVYKAQYNGGEQCFKTAEQYLIANPSATVEYKIVSYGDIIKND